jgi:hypothetical protein
MYPRAHPAHLFSAKRLRLHRPPDGLLLLTSIGRTRQGLLGCLCPCRTQIISLTLRDSRKCLESCGYSWATRVSGIIDATNGARISPADALLGCRLGRELDRTSSDRNETAARVRMNRARISLTLRSVLLALTALPAGQCLVVAGAEAWSTECGRTDALTRRAGICAIRCARIGSSIGKTLSGVDRGVRTCRSSSDHAKQEYG